MKEKTKGKGVRAEAAVEADSIPSLEQLLSAGVHFGHQKRRWNPQISPYLFPYSGKVHVFDLVKTQENLRRASQFLYEATKEGGSVIFVGTKRQAARVIKESAESCGAFSVNKRWLGGTITNFASVRQKMLRLDRIEKGLLRGGEFESFTKKERLDLSREGEVLETDVGGLRRMNNLPQALFVIDIRRESTAVAEARKKGIPVVALVDSNCSPNGIAYPIPGNDDSVSSIELIVKTVAQAVSRGRLAYASADKEAGATLKEAVEPAAAAKKTIRVVKAKKEPRAKVVKKSSAKTAKKRGRPKTKH